LQNVLQVFLELRYVLVSSKLVARLLDFLLCCVHSLVDLGLDCLALCNQIVPDGTLGEDLVDILQVRQQFVSLCFPLLAHFVEFLVSWYFL
jgi:hypothetical protein